MSVQSVSFVNKRGITLRGRIEFPITQHPRAFVILAHVFTGNKNLIGVRYITKSLCAKAFAVLRFDFTGLGESDGDFSESNFTTNIEDIEAAAQFLSDNYRPASMIVGQSLGGAASIFASSKIDSIKAVATIGAPSETEHVMHLFDCEKDEILQKGSMPVTIGGRAFVIKRQFIEDLEKYDLPSMAKGFRKALLLMHSPQDEIVAIEHAANLYHAAFHPKSFITLDGANHMLTDKDDAHYAGEVIASWVGRYIDKQEKEELHTQEQVVARLGTDGYTTDIKVGKHNITADEPKDVGGNDFGPSPYGLLVASLAACKAMTAQMYARRKGWNLEEVNIHLSFDRIYANDCEDCDKPDKKIDEFKAAYEFIGKLDEKQKMRLMEIANKCPVHKTIAGNPRFQSALINT